jgi:hypothetical protein
MVFLTRVALGNPYPWSQGAGRLNNPHENWARGYLAAMRGQLQLVPGTVELIA